MDKRINILFDHLNNEDLLQPDTVQQMVDIAQHVQRKEWDQAQSLFTEMQTAKLETEGTHWMVSWKHAMNGRNDSGLTCRQVGVKRLIAIGRATKV